MSARPAQSLRGRAFALLTPVPLCVIVGSLSRAVVLQEGTSLQRKLIWIIAAFVVAALLLSGCGGLPPTPTALPSPTAQLQGFELVVLHTNDVRGYTEPCG